MTVTGTFSDYLLKPAGRHRLAVWLLAAFYATVIVWTLIHGFSYYRLPLEDRPYHPLNRELRPSGPTGIRLGLLGVATFLGIFLYAVRKRWKTLGRIGKTKNWLDLHVVMGVSAPVLITFHAGFRMRGLAGTSYWIMLAVALSGIVGRYLYSQIPRRINAAELSLQEMQTMTDDLTSQLQRQSLVSAEELKPLLAVPTKARVEAMPVVTALLLMAACDLKRPLLVARIRRRALVSGGGMKNLWGLLPSPEPGLEKVIDLARNRSWMATKISFLSKTHQVFHLWHVVHRPFSYSFAILVCVHICVAVLMGYF
ncbi:MAG TPA: hypothetical protein VKT49_12335 [Bryobacteraceae bacterium]|nr:hypothetical protein [Bryobacteraceae bacterium]